MRTHRGQLIYSDPPSPIPRTVPGHHILIDGLPVRHLPLVKQYLHYFPPPCFVLPNFV